MNLAASVWTDHAHGMLTELYIEALLVDEELADQVFEAWGWETGELESDKAREMGGSGD